MQPLQPSTKRIESIGLLRGRGMIIMARDHTRDFFHKEAFTGDPLNPETTTAALYFTRWINHFCAPTFVFLSGVSAYNSTCCSNISTHKPTIRHKKYGSTSPCPRPCCSSS